MIDQDPPPKDAPDDAPEYSGGPVPDPAEGWKHYDRVIIRRIVGYIIDILVIALLETVLLSLAVFLGFLTWGLFTVPLFALAALIPFAYHTLLIGGARSATLGMRFMGVEVHRMEGGPPDYVLAALVTIVFYVTVGLFWPVLAVALFNRHKRPLHDILCGTVVLNSDLD